MDAAEWIKLVALPAFLGLVWLIRLEGRQNSHERACEQRQKNLDERHATITATMTRMDGKLDRLLEERP